MAMQGRPGKWAVRRDEDEWAAAGRDTRQRIRPRRTGPRVLDRGGAGRDTSETLSSTTASAAPAIHTGHRRTTTARTEAKPMTTTPAITALRTRIPAIDKG